MAYLRTSSATNADRLDQPDRSSVIRELLAEALMAHRRKR
jgi:hypothetical protein